MNLSIYSGQTLTVSWMRAGTWTFPERRRCAPPVPRPAVAARQSGHARHLARRGRRRAVPRTRGTARAGSRAAPDGASRDTAGPAGTQPV